MRESCFTIGLTRLSKLNLYFMCSYTYSYLHLSHSVLTLYILHTLYLTLSISHTIYLTHSISPTLYFTLCISHTLYLSLYISHSHSISHTLFISQVLDSSFSSFRELVLKHPMAMKKTGCGAALCVLYPFVRRSVRM